jgi:single stranded DNA-binding protein
MRNQANIELIGYVYGEPETPQAEKYPNLVKFSLSVTTKWKTKSGEYKKEMYWYKCSSWSEGLSKVIKEHVKGGMGLLVRGFPKSNAYIDKEGVAKSQIEVNITEINMLTYPDDNKAYSGSKLSSNTKADIPDIEFHDDDIPF